MEFPFLEISARPAMRSFWPRRLGQGALKGWSRRTLHRAATNIAERMDDMSMHNGKDEEWHL